jgi:hypothetical protein
MKKILLKLATIIGLSTAAFAQLPSPAVFYNFDATMTNTGTGTATVGNNYNTTYTFDRNAVSSKALAANSVTSISSALFPQANNSRTVSFWVKFNAINSSVQNLFSFGSGVPTKAFCLQVNASGYLLFSNYQNQFISTFSPLANQWYHITTTYDKATGYAKLYVDGVLKYTTINMPLAIDNSAFYIGSIVGVQTSINAVMDDLGIYTEALTESQVNVLFTSNPVTPSQNIVNGTFDANTYTSTLGAYNSWSGYAGASTEFYGNADNSGVLTSSLTPVTQGGECIAWGKPKGNCIDWAPITISGYTLKNSSISQSVTIKEIPVSLTGVYKFAANLAKYNGLVLVDGNYNGTRFTDTLELKDYSSVVRTVTEADKDTITLTLGSHTEPCVKTCDGKICDDNCPVLDQVTITLQACGTCPSGAAEASNTTRMVVDNLKLNFSVPTAIQDELLSSQYAAVYPNPVIDILNVDGYAEVLNLMGEKVAEGNSRSLFG